MYKIKPLIYRDFIPLAESNKCGRAYWKIVAGKETNYAVWYANLNRE